VWKQKEYDKFSMIIINNNNGNKTVYRRRRRRIPTRNWKLESDRTVVLRVIKWRTVRNSNTASPGEWPPLHRPRRNRTWRRRGRRNYRDETDDIVVRRYIRIYDIIIYTRPILIHTSSSLYTTTTINNNMTDVFDCLLE